MKKNCWFECPTKRVEKMADLIKYFDAEEVIVLDGGKSEISEIDFTGNDLTIKCVEAFGFEVHILDF